MLPLPANSIAVPPVPMIAPPSKMLTAWALLISMPAEPETTPVLKMPPVKVGPAMSIAVLLARTSLKRVDADAGSVALMLPLSTMPPATVAVKTPMPSFPAMVPELTIPARKHAYLRNINASSARRDHAGVGDASRKSTKTANQTQSIVRCRDRAAVDDGAAAAGAAEYRDTGQSDTIGANDLAAVADVAKESLGVHEYAATAGDRAGVRYPPGDASRPKRVPSLKSMPRR